MSKKLSKIIDLLDNTPNEPCKFRTRNLVEINDKSRGTYNANNQIKFKTLMMRWNVCDYNDAYIYVKGAIEVQNTSSGKQSDLGQSLKAQGKVVLPFLCTLFLRIFDT